MTENQYYIVENVIANWEAQAPSVDDFLKAADVLGLYDGEADEVQSLVNVIRYLEKAAKSKERRALLNEVKREYAAEHGVKFSQVRVSKKVA